MDIAKLLKKAIDIDEMDAISLNDHICKLNRLLDATDRLYEIHTDPYMAYVIFEGLANEILTLEKHIANCNPGIDICKDMWRKVDRFRQEQNILIEKYAHTSVNSNGLFKMEYPKVTQ